jgi:hypothetical protein
MKSKFFMAAIAAAMLFASCSNEDTPVVAEKDVLVTIKLGGVKTRLVEDPGILGELEMVSGWIYVIAPNGVITHNEQLNVPAAVGAGSTTAGQTLRQLISADSRIYVIGNIPNLAAYPNGVNPIPVTGGWNGIKLATGYMATQNVVDADSWKTAALANSDGQPVAINISDNRNPAGVRYADVTVPVKPVISRVELAEVVGGGNILGYDVTGVWIDDTYPQFVWGGGHAGAIRSQDMDTDFSLHGVPGNEGSWSAAAVTIGGTDRFVASPANNKVWAHNVASAFNPFDPLDGYLIPRFLIRIENVELDPAYQGRPLDVDYLTVINYKDAGGTPITHFERGKIYQVGGPKGTYSFEFDEDNLETLPNRSTVELEVTVKVIDWVPVVIIPGL